MSAYGWVTPTRASQMPVPVEPSEVAWSEPPARTREREPQWAARRAQADCQPPRQAGASELRQKAWAHARRAGELRPRHRVARVAAQGTRHHRGLTCNRPESLPGARLDPTGVDGRRRPRRRAWSDRANERPRQSAARAPEPRSL